MRGKGLNLAHPEEEEEEEEEEEGGEMEVIEFFPQEEEG